MGIEASLLLDLDGRAVEEPLIIHSIGGISLFFLGSCEVVVMAVSSESGMHDCM